jgi:hypothetical protein
MNIKKFMEKNKKSSVSGQIRKYFLSPKLGKLNSGNQRIITPSLGNKNGELMQQLLVEIIVVALVFGLFFLALNYKVQADGVKAQVIEKQTALLIEGGERGMSYNIYKSNRNGVIWKMEIINNKIFAYPGKLQYTEGYPFFTRYDVDLEEKEDRFVISIK